MTAAKRDDGRELGVGDDHFGFDAVPIEPVPAGTSLMVTGPSLDGLRELLLELLVGSRAEGTLLVAADVDSASATTDFEAVGGDDTPGRLRVVDCSPDVEAADTEYVRHVASPGDLTGIGMEFSALYEAFYADGCTRVRTGIYTLAPLLVYTQDLRTVFRFVHTITGRVRSAGGLCACAIDPSTQDERTINSLAHAFDGKVELRRGEEGSELRVRGLADQPEGWQPFEPIAARR